MVGLVFSDLSGGRAEKGGQKESNGKVTEEAEQGEGREGGPGRLPVPTGRWTWVPDRENHRGGPDDGQSG